MPNREKVINGLRFTSAMLLFNPLTGAEKAPSDLNEDDRTTYDACVGAIALLRDPVKSIWKDYKGYAYAVCGECGAPMCHVLIFNDKYFDSNYCPCCGRKVEWTKHE